MSGLAVLVALSVAPGSAAAATLGTNGSALEYRASAGGNDSFVLQYRRNRDFYTAAPPDGVVSRAPCFRGSDPDVRGDSGTPAKVIAGCPAAGLRIADVGLGDGDDNLTVLRDEIFRPDGDRDDALLPIRPLIVHADGGPGNDQVYAGPLDDILLGGPGDDGFFGFAGDDVVRGGAGRDRVEGGEGGDRIYGDSGADALNGTGGRDRISGGAGNDKINGGGFAFGTDRRDTIYGGAGNDKLTDIQNGRESAGDRYFAGTGSDRIDDRDGNRDIIDCGAGRDTVISDQRDKVARNCERVRRKFRSPGRR